MSASVHKAKVEVDGRVIKAEIRPGEYPSRDWALVDGVQNATIVLGFRAQSGAGDHPIVASNPNDAIRIRVEQDNLYGEIRISVDREHGGAWYSESKHPTMVIKFDSAFRDDVFCEGAPRRIRLSVDGGDLKDPIEIGMMNLFPPAKPDKK